MTPKDRVSVAGWDQYTQDMHGCKVFSKIDLKSSYHQIPLCKESQRKTAFSIGTRRFMFRTVPQGLSNSPATLQRLLNMVLSGVKNCLHYMDDLLISTKTNEEHEEVLSEVFRRLADAKLQIALDKCTFFSRSATFLGFIVSKHGVAPDPRKTEALMRLEPPQTLEGVRSCLGQFNVFRRHIQGYAEISRPISEVTKGFPVKRGRNVKINWTPEADAALEILKRACVQNVMLVFPKFADPFHVHTDASLKAIGAVVSQEVLDEDTGQK